MWIKPYCTFRLHNSTFKYNIIVLVPLAILCFFFNLLLCLSLFYHVITFYFCLSYVILSFYHSINLSLYLSLCNSLFLLSITFTYFIFRFYHSITFSSVFRYVIHGFFLLSPCYLMLFFGTYPTWKGALARYKKRLSAKRINYKISDEFLRYLMYKIKRGGSNKELGDVTGNLLKSRFRTIYKLYSTTELAPKPLHGPPSNTIVGYLME